MSKPIVNDSTAAPMGVTDITSNTIKLTEKQTQVLQFIADEIKSHSMPPTRAEIAEHFGYKSNNAAQSHLEALYQRGAIELPLAISRGIKITPDGWNAIGVQDWQQQWSELNKGPHYWQLIRSKYQHDQWEFYASGSMDSFTGNSPEECVSKAYQHTITEAIIASGVSS